MSFHQLLSRTLVVLLLGLNVVRPVRADEAPEPVAVRRLQAGDRYRVSLLEKTTGYLLLDDPKTKKKQKLEIAGTWDIKYRERALKQNRAGTVYQTLRLYESLKCNRTVGDQPQKAELRKDVQRLVLHRTDKHKTNAYSPDGALTFAEVDFINHHLFLPGLEGLLPDGNLKNGLTWKATESAILELGNLDEFTEGQLNGKFKFIQNKGQWLGQIHVYGTFTGKTVDGLSKQQINGAVYIDPKNGRLHSLHVIGISYPLGKDDEKLGEIKTDFQAVVRYDNTDPPLETDPRLSDRQVSKLPEKPGTSLTALVYPHPGLGIEILHPRTWFLAQVVGNSMHFEREKSSLLVELQEDGKTPTPQKYQQEVVDALGKMKNVKVIRKGTISEDSQGDVKRHRFRIRAILKGNPTILDYWVVTQGKRGLTATARISQLNAARDLDALEFIVKSAKFTSDTLKAEKKDDKKK